MVFVCYYRNNVQGISFDGHLDQLLKAFDLYNAAFHAIDDTSSIHSYIDLFDKHQSNIDDALTHSTQRLKAVFSDRPSDAENVRQLNEIENNFISEIRRASLYLRNDIKGLVFSGKFRTVINQMHIAVDEYQEAIKG